MADKFLQGEFSVEIFTEQFQELRRIAHIRRIKADKMEELQLNGHISSPIPTSVASGSSLHYSSPSGGALPYSSPQPSGASPYSSPRRPAPQPPLYPVSGGSGMGYSAPAQNQPWRPPYASSGGMPMPTLGSYPH